MYFHAKSSVQERDSFSSSIHSCANEKLEMHIYNFGLRHSISDDAAIFSNALCTSFRMRVQCLVQSYSVPYSIHRLPTVIAINFRENFKCKYASFYSQLYKVVCACVWQSFPVYVCIVASYTVLTMWTVHTCVAYSFESYCSWWQQQQQQHRRFHMQRTNVHYIEVHRASECLAVNIEGCQLD